MMPTMPKPTFRAIPQYPRAHYEVCVPWRDVDRMVVEYQNERLAPLNIEPDYQRGHVWTNEQRTAFVEYGLMGGESSMVLTFNCPGWDADWRGPFELVDGLQRLTAVRMFVNDEIAAFGHYYREYQDRLSSNVYLRWRVLKLPTRAEVLRLYLLMNSGGVIHSPDEIARVRALLDKEST